MLGQPSRRTFFLNGSLLPTWRKQLLWSLLWKENQRYVLLVYNNFRHGNYSHQYIKSQKNSLLNQPTLKLPLSETCLKITWLLLLIGQWRNCRQTIPSLQKVILNISVLIVGRFIYADLCWTTKKTGFHHWFSILNEEDKYPMNWNEFLTMVRLFTLF